MKIIVYIALTIQIVALYLYQANELTTLLLTSKPLDVQATSHVAKGDRNDKAMRHLDV